jgi:TRAP-type C4-dicarboxylate transport system substrate-binding protein
MNATWQRNLGLLALMAASVTACSADPDSSSADRGSTPPSTGQSTGTATPAVDSDPAVDPIVLRLGTGDAKTAPAADQIRWFVKRAAELTGGAVTIKPVWLAAGDERHFETAMAHQAIDGDLDLALVASRAWDTVGVRTLTPLNAPFLVTSDELVAQVVADPIQGDLLSGLPEAGVVGLGLWPEGLRHPFGFAEPLDGPGDYDGTLVRAPYSRTTREMFRALGARTTDGAPDPSTQRGAESAYRLAPAGTATGNVVFYPKVNALVANAEVEAALTDAQRDALEQAAADTRDWVLDTWPTDNEAARTFCDEGGRIQAATAAQAESMVEATRSVVEAMSADDELGPIIAEIQQVGTGIEAEQPLLSCGDETDAEALAVLNGSYVFTVSPDAARRAGVTDQEVIDNATGDFTVTMKDGQWTLEQVYATGPMKDQTDHGLGDYTIDGNRLEWFWGHEPGAWVKATFQVLPDGSVGFSDVTDGEGPQWELMAQVHFHHWERIGR